MKDRKDGDHSSVGSAQRRSSRSMRRVFFLTGGGRMLAGSLDLPVEKPKAFAVFAHCFTCTKDFPAAARISRGLAERGYAVLRFDFSGLGGSDGDFSETNFSSNIEDVKAAASFLRNNYQAPEILIGHSLGGVAALAAGEELKEVIGVVTIAAPSNLSHLKQVMGEAAIDAIQSGVGNLEVAGRNYVIRKQFFEDLERHVQDGTSQKVTKALLVIHSSSDTMLEMAHAHAIFAFGTASRKLVQLDDADHLLSKSADTHRVVDTIDEWHRGLAAE